MASSLVRTGFVRGSMTQGNGCYQHRCINNSLEVYKYYNHCVNLIFKPLPPSLFAPTKFTVQKTIVLCHIYL